MEGKMKKLQITLFIIAIAIAITAVISYGRTENYVSGILFAISAVCFFGSAIINSRTKNKK